jgi:hypothetical protein
MNRWHVYEYLRTGTIPQIDVICADLSQLDWDEIQEGIDEVLYDNMAIKAGGGREIEKRNIRQQ